MFFSLLLCFSTLGLVDTPQGRTLRVGPGRDYAEPHLALAAAEPGDVILVYPRPESQPYERVALRVRKPRITIRAFRDDMTRVGLSGKGFDYSGRGSVPRAIVQFDAGADGGRLEGFELFGGHNDTHNGAGVRIVGADGVTISECEIHGNDMGIMSSGDGKSGRAADQRIERCHVHWNGSLEDPGYNHNLYLGGDSVTVIGCEIASSVTGHNIKSRAHVTVVEACRVHHSANREFDLVDADGDTTRPGSHAWLIGNVIEKANPCRGNRSVIHFGQDGGHDHHGTVYLIHNTIVTSYRAAVVELSAENAKAQLYGNLIWDDKTRASGQRLVAGSDAASVSGRTNWVSRGFAESVKGCPGLSDTVVAEREMVPPFVSHKGAGRELNGVDPLITDRADWSDAEGVPEDVRRRIASLKEYRVGPRWAERPVVGPHDLGAHEWVVTDAEPESFEFWLRVVDDKGAPVKGCTVADDQFIGTVDAAGRWHHPLDQTRYLEVACPGYGTQTIIPTPGHETMETAHVVVLDPETVLTLEFESARPRKITIMSKMRGSRGSQREYSYGRSFVIDQLWADSLYVFVESAEGAEYIIEVEDVGPDRRVARRVPDPVRATGKVTRAPGETLEDLAIVAYPVHSLAMSYCERGVWWMMDREHGGTRTAADGSFSLDVFPGKTWVGLAPGRGVAPLGRCFDITEATSIELPVGEVECGRLSGRVLGSDGKPVAMAVVSLSYRDGGPIAGLAMEIADFNGEFEFGPVPLGEVWLGSLTGGGSVSAERLTVATVTKGSGTRTELRQIDPEAVGDGK